MAATTGPIPYLQALDLSELREFGAAADKCGFAEFCRGLSLNFVAAGQGYAAASSAVVPGSSLRWRVR
jgi:hypothetical protein